MSDLNAEIIPRVTHSQPYTVSFIFWLGVVSYFEIFSAALCVLCVETAIFNAEIIETRRGPPR